MQWAMADRRRFLGVTSAVAGGLWMSAPAAAAGTKGEYLLAEDLTYLNTGTLGPCRRATVEETSRHWESLEANPVSFYGGLGAESLAEKTRSVAANFLGCDLN